MPVDGDAADKAARYFPPPESEGGWRWLADPGRVLDHAGVELGPLELEFRRQQLLYGGDSWGIVVVRHGWLAAECSTFNVASTSCFDLWSCTKSFTSLAWGMLLHSGAPDVAVTLDTPAYDLIPEGWPLTDPRKERITVGHLLSMTSGIAGESRGIYGMPTSADGGVFEFALGRAANRFGADVGRLIHDPGSAWDYSDPAYCHLSLAFTHVTKQTMAQYLRERVFEKIGVEQALWEYQGGRGFLGPVTNAHTGMHMSARDLARVGYLIANDGFWAGEAVVPTDWIHQATRPSQPCNRAYGFGWWSNADDRYLPGLPRDMVAMSGYRSNRCYVIPSLDLVVARVGGGPTGWDEPQLLRAVVGSCR